MVNDLRLTPAYACSRFICLTGDVSSNNAKLHTVRGLEDLIRMASCDTGNLPSRRERAIFRMYSTHFPRQNPPPCPHTPPHCHLSRFSPPPPHSSHLSITAFPPPRLSVRQPAPNHRLSLLCEGHANSSKQCGGVSTERKTVPPYNPENRRVQTSCLCQVGPIHDAHTPPRAPALGSGKVKWDEWMAAVLVVTAIGCTGFTLPPSGFNDVCMQILPRCARPCTTHGTACGEWVGVRCPCNA
jgi:hypothetical protein